MRTTVRGFAVAALGLGAAVLAATLVAPQSHAQPPNDPLIPKDQKEVKTSFVACKACHNEKLPVDAKDNEFAKKFHSHEFILLSEGRTWRQEDPHSRSYDVLKTPLGEQMSRILKYDVLKAPQCLTCHAMDVTPTAPLAEKKFEVTEGITCTGCHGLREPWQSEHYADADVGGKRTIAWRGMTPDYKEQKGMRNLRDPAVRGQFCSSCHVGSAKEGKVVTHDMYAAGHPPLPPFEIGTFMDNEPKHWGYPVSDTLKFFTDANTGFAGEDAIKKQKDWQWNLYRFHPKKDESYMARQVTAGAIAALQAEMNLIAADATATAGGKGEGVDFARFDCYACHHDLAVPSDRQKRGYPGAPGRPPLKAWVGALAGVVVDHAAGIDEFKTLAAGYADKWAAVQKASIARPFGDPAGLAKAAGEMDAWCQDFLKADSKAARPLYTQAQADKLLAAVAAAAASDRWSADPEAAMHLTWAYLALRKGSDNPVPEPKLQALKKVVPIQVRYAPYSNKDGNPTSVGEVLEDRLRVFRGFQSKPFLATIRDISGSK